MATAARKPKKLAINAKFVLFAYTVSSDCLLGWFIGERLKGTQNYVDYKSGGSTICTIREDPRVLYYQSLKSGQILLISEQTSNKIKKIKVEKVKKTQLMFTNISNNKEYQFNPNDTICSVSLK